MKYTDPSGEMFWLSFLMKAGLTNFISEASQGNINNLGDAGKAFITGSVGGFAGFGATFLAPNSNIPLLGGLAGGFASGLTSLLYGDSFTDGFLQGVPSGIQGYWYGRYFLKHKKVMTSINNASNTNYLISEGVVFNSDGSILCNPDNAEIYYDAAFEETFTADAGLRNYIAGDQFVYIESTNTLYELNNKGIYEPVSGGGKPALGMIDPHSTTTNFGSYSFTERWSNVVLSKKAFNSKWSLFNIMGHELNHVAMHCNNLPQSEAFCYSWNVLACIINNNYENYDFYMRQSITRGYFTLDLSIYPNFGLPYHMP